MVVAQVNQTQLTPTAFLQTVLVQFGFSPFNMKKPEVLATMNQFLTEQHAAGKKVLLIIDEAQNLTSRVLEEVRMLSGVETTKEKVLRIILAGQPELNEKLNSPELVQLTQRVRLRFHLTALTREETASYIEHRLEVAGSQGRRIFAEDTYPTIFKYTGGTPRLINTLCDTAMMSAFGRDRDTVGMEDIEAALGELQWIEFGAGISRLRAAQMAHHPRASHADADGDAHTQTYPDVHPGLHPLGRILLASHGTTLVERELKPGRLVIGRTPDNDLQVDSKFISRHHCQIITQADACVIEDLNSTNGIYVQSKRVRRHNLNDGDVVQVGQHEIMYIDERPPRLRHASEHVDTGVHDKAGSAVKS